MNFFTNLLGYLKQHFSHDVADIEADLGKAEEYLQAHAASYKQLASVVVDALKVLDPELAPGVTAVVGEAEKVLTEAEALYEKYFGPKD